MSIEQMEYMLALEQERKISYAAKRCFISQPALSQQLAKIEKELGISLFTKKNNEYIPTQEGQILLNAYRKILQTYRESLRQLEQHRALSQQSITLGLPNLRAATLFTYIYPRFQKSYPSCSLNLLELPVVKTQEMLDSRAIDFGLFSPAIELPRESRDRYVYSRIAREELVLVAPPGHEISRLAAARNQTLDVCRLNGLELALYEKNFIVRDLIDVYFDRHHITCKNIISFKSGSTLIQFARQDLALSIVPHMFALSQPDLSVIHLDPPLTQEIGLLSLSRFQGTAMENLIVSLFRDAFRSMPDVRIH